MSQVSPSPPAPEKPHKSLERLLIWLAVCLALLWAVVAALPFISLCLPPSSSEETHESFKEVLQQWGLFGDMFNALNALFTAAALAGVIYTAILQRSQITMQLTELANSAQQLTLAADELKLAREEREEARTAQALANANALEQKQLQLKAMLLNAQSAMLQASAAIACSNISAAVSEQGKDEAKRWAAELTKSTNQFEKDIAAAK